MRPSNHVLEPATSELGHALVRTKVREGGWVHYSGQGSSNLPKQNAGLPWHVLFSRSTKMRRRHCKGQLKSGGSIAIMVVHS